MSDILDFQLLVIIALTFVIHLIGTLAYAFRIAGIRTGHIAIAFSLFNVLVLVSRLSNSLQAPFMAKRVETAISAQAASGLIVDFSLILASASVATVVGGLLIPSFQRYSSNAVRSFHRTRSMPRLLLRTLTPRGASLAMHSLALPSHRNLVQLARPKNIPFAMIAMNFLASALWTVGVLASIYAGILEPEFRVTASSLSSMINGIATIMMFILVDPYLSGMTDDVVSGRVSDGHFRRVITWLVISRLCGTLAAQLLLLPAAHAIAWMARAL
ncbi:lipid II flippase Amj family protein [Pararhizobium haloflavum]|uniref:lipid II flippase Amj family protein n=1 Tax=Pararhizobium haloflavum TaxID=2037914 RepID=UPI0018E4BBC1|nr:lipid II flippase Amj family protein [Pararhizobium haloflavum]